LLAGSVGRSSPGHVMKLLSHRTRDTVAERRKQPVRKAWMFQLSVLLGYSVYLTSGVFLSEGIQGGITRRASTSSHFNCNQGGDMTEETQSKEFCDMDINIF